MAERDDWIDASDEVILSQGDRDDEMGSAVRLYDSSALRAAIGADDDFVDPEEARPSTSPARTTEEEVRIDRLRRILSDPRGATRPALHGSTAMVERLIAATASMRHFDAVTGIIERAVRQSAFTRRPMRVLPILMVSAPGLGKTYYCRMVAQALRTTCIPIAINGTSDRGQLGGLSSLWRGAKTGKIADGLLVKSSTAAPVYLLDEIDKSSSLVTGENMLDVLLLALEPENAQAFVDEYLDFPIDLRSALWLASANDISAMPAPLLDRMLIVDIPLPDEKGSRILAGAVAESVLAQNGLAEATENALAAVLNHAPRRMRCLLELACGFATSAGRLIVTEADVRSALHLTSRDRRSRVGFLYAEGQNG